MLKNVVLGSAALFGAGLARQYCCSRVKLHAHGDKNRVLKEEEASARAALLHDVSYQLSLDMAAQSTTYQGLCIIQAQVHSDDAIWKEHAATLEKGVFLDFTGQTIHSITINGKSVTAAAHRDKWWSSERITIPAEFFKNVAQVSIEIRYTNVFDVTGDGFVRYVDPQDNNEYFYTNFEPFCAHRLFPCFDQPDLKATLALTVTAPSKWSVWGNSPEFTELALPLSSGLTRHTFQTTKKIPTYVFAIVVGPYHTFVDTYDNGRIPLTLSCRRSLAQYLDYEELFEITKQGFAFYEEYFGMNYPFEKYDQIFCSDYNMGAMENVGLVTYNELYIFRDPPTQARKAKRADTFLHEMAHMWFGNTCTMKWWNGLWLNESFATYMAALAIASATKYSSLSWLNFNSVMKAWGYREDQLPTTHPVEAKVDDTDVAITNFDALTYGKGASLLQQLVYVVGADNFKAGMQYYFAKYAWKNTTLADFLDALSYATSKSGVQFDPVTWTEQFLLTSGLNTVQSQLNVKDGVVQELSLIQSAPVDHNHLRPHCTCVAMFDWNEEKQSLSLRDTFKVTLSTDSSKTVINAAQGQSAPAFVFANHDDHAYLKVLLDETSLQFVLQKLDTLPSPLLRQLVWQSLFNMVRDAGMSSIDYLQVVSRSLVNEKDPKLVATILQNASSAAYFFVPDKFFDQENDRMFHVLFNMLLACNVDEHRELMLPLSDSVIDFARTASSVAALVPYLEDGKKLGQHTFAQGQRWKIVVKAIAFGLDADKQLLAVESKRDGSDQGRKEQLRAQSSYPDAANKAAAWKRIHDEADIMPSHDMSAFMSGFLYKNQSALTSSYHFPAISELVEVYKKHDKEFANAFFYHLIPFEPENDELIERLSEPSFSSNEHLQRNLKEHLDSLMRAKKCRQFVLAKSD